MKALKNEDGYTLMELLVVLVILGLIAGIAAPQIMKYLGRAKSGTADLQIEAIVSALDFYKMDAGTYPTTEQGLNALLEKPEDAKSWFGPYVSKQSNILDPWGEPFKYRYPGEHGDFDVYSWGADKREGGEGDNADIISWEP